MGLAFGLPSSASAQLADSRYCQALSDAYAGFLITGNRLDADPRTASGRAGIEQCRVGNTAAGIPLLESGLRNAGIDLPPRSAPKYIATPPGPAKGG
jgi:hypothetical protein